MEIETTFQSKFIIKDIKEEELQIIVENLITNAWLDHDIPENVRTIKCSKKLSLEHLPKSFSIKNTAKTAIKKGILSLPKIGTVNIYLKFFISKLKKENPTYKIEIDKFEYEKDGSSLDIVVKKSIF